MGHGGKRVGAGRKPRADELKVAEKFRYILSDEYVIKKLSEKVEQGDLKAIELWIAYTNGKPRQPVEMDVEVNNVNFLSIDPLADDSSNNSTS
jgi:hypothetical protein